jgi:hypothetical protein
MAFSSPEANRPPVELRFSVHEVPVLSSLDSRHLNANADISLRGPAVNSPAPLAVLFSNGFIPATPLILCAQRRIPLLPTKEWKMARPRKRNSKRNSNPRNTGVLHSYDHSLVAPQEAAPVSKAK